MSFKSKLISTTAATVIAATGALHAEESGTLMASMSDLENRLESDMNAMLSDMRAQSDILGDVIAISDDFSVDLVPVSNGVFEFTMPEMTTSMNDGIATYTVDIPSQTYTLSVNDYDAAIAAISLGSAIDVTMNPVSDVEAGLSIGDEYETFMSANFVCGDNGQTASLAPTHYSFSTSSNSCAMNANIDGAMTATMEGDFFVDTTKHEDGTYSYADSMSLMNVSVEFNRSFGDSVNFNVDAVNVSSQMEGMPSLQGRTVDQLTLADLPASAYSSVSVEGMSLSGTNPFTGGIDTYGPLSVNMSVALDDLRSDSATISSEFGYDMTGIQAGTDFPELQEIPEISQCDMSFSGIPVEQIQQLFDQYGITPDNFVHVGGEMIVADVLARAPISAEYNCLVQDGPNGSNYQVELTGSHNFQDGLPVGSGTVTVTGADNLNSSVMAFGPAAFMFSGMFNSFAVPSDDGSTHVIEYEVKEDGMVFVNDQPVTSLQP